MIPNSLFPQTDDRLLAYYLRETVLSIIPLEGKDETKKREGQFLFLLLGLMLVTNTDPLKVVLRENIGKLAFSFHRLLVACALFFIYGIVLICMSGRMPANLFFIAGIFYIGLSIYITVLGYRCNERAKELVVADPELKDTMKHLYRGDSIIFKRFITKDWDYRKVWLFTETISCVVISLLLTVLPALYNPHLAFLGAPLLVTSLSFAFNEAFQLRNVWNVAEKKVKHERQKTTMNKQLYSNNTGFPRKAI
jgi:hypothetical protein